MGPFESIVEEDYRGEHTAPNRYSGDPMHDLSVVYPSDFYSDKGFRYYATGGSSDAESYALIIAAHKKPNKPVKIYRAVPKVLTVSEKISDLESQLSYILKYGKIPQHVNTSLSKSKYYDQVSSELELLRKKRPTSVESKVTINPGDWVSITRSYAANHGRGLGRYKILSKTVRAKDLYTNGDSLNEWGYDPS